MSEKLFEKSQNSHHWCILINLDSKFILSWFAKKKRKIPVNRMILVSLLHVFYEINMFPHRTAVGMGGAAILKQEVSLPITGGSYWWSCFQFPSGKFDFGWFSCGFI